MKLINIERLSDSELRYMASEENIEDYANQSREELIDELEEIYGDDRPDLFVNKKYLSSLTRGDSETTPIPGTRPLPDDFSETEIRFVMKNHIWAYVMWSIDSHTRERLEQENALLSLEVVAQIERENKPSRKNKIGKSAEDESERTVRERESFQIDISSDDTSWNIEFPWLGRTYVIKLQARYNGKTETLASTHPWTVREAYLEKNPEILKDPVKYKVLASSLVTTGGKQIGVNRVREALEGSVAWRRGA